MSISDTVSISAHGLCSLFGGLLTSVGIDSVAGKIGFSHAMIVRIASAKTDGEFDVHHPFVFFWTCILP